MMIEELKCSLLSFRADAKIKNKKANYCCFTVQQKNRVASIASTRFLLSKNEILFYTVIFAHKF